MLVTYHNGLAFKDFKTLIFYSTWDYASHDVAQ